MTVHGAKERAAFNAGRLHPAAQRLHRAGSRIRAKGNAHLASGALLVGLRFRNSDHDALQRGLQIGNLNADQFGASESPSKANKSECAVAQAE
jgi:hypothetical protein